MNYRVTIKLFHNVIKGFFFSRKRRRTILQGDWSSDVCSSDLVKLVEPCLGLGGGLLKLLTGAGHGHHLSDVAVELRPEKIGVDDRRVRLGIDDDDFEEATGEIGRASWRGRG